MLPKNVLDSLNYVAGEFDMDVTEGNEQKRKAINVLIHPDYDHTDSYNDIAIVTVNDPYVYTKYVQPIPVDRPPVVPEVGTVNCSKVFKIRLNRWFNFNQRGNVPNSSEFTQ